MQKSNDEIRVSTDAAATATPTTAISHLSNNLTYESPAASAGTNPDTTIIEMVHESSEVPPYSEQTRLSLITKISLNFSENPNFFNVNRPSRLEDKIPNLIFVSRMAALNAELFSKKTCMPARPMVRYVKQVKEAVEQWTKEDEAERRNLSYKIKTDRTFNPNLFISVTIQFYEKRTTAPNTDAEIITEDLPPYSIIRYNVEGKIEFRVPALNAALSQVNSGGVQAALLLNPDGTLVAFAGGDEADARKYAAVAANIWVAYERHTGEGLARFRRTTPNNASTPAAPVTTAAPSDIMPPSLVLGLTGVPKDEEGLRSVVVVCEFGKISMASVAGLLLCLIASENVELGILKAKTKALKKYLEPPLETVLLTS
ncbi:Ragulator complex protein lamtor2 [Physocladia obscura]|uniref:Ragulator complex protein lamtor2 n=1 Tax=Physocladia obscura TaxID=109957 RepID=A0AAD5TCB3_9FUNG|nr:Ragulator complex protein lamtor2 [Physocladia obscura]